MDNKNFWSHQTFLINQNFIQQRIFFFFFSPLIARFRNIKYPIYDKILCINQIFVDAIHVQLSNMSTNIHHLKSIPKKK